MNKRSDGSSFFPGGSPRDMSLADSGNTILYIRGDQVRQLIPILKKDSEPCRVFQDLYINDTAVRKGSYVIRVFTYDCSYASCSAVIDLLYILRFHTVIRVEFSFKRHSLVQSLSNNLLISQSILYLLQCFSLILKQHSSIECRAELVKNHCLTLWHLCEYNSSISFLKLFSLWNVEHVLVVERYLIQAIQTALPAPILSHKDCLGMYHDSIFLPSLSYMRYLHRRIPSNKAVLFNQLLQFYYAIFSLYGCYPTDEIVSILCEFPDRLVVSAFICAYPFLFQDHRQLWIASCMLKYLTVHTIQVEYVALPTDVQQVRIAELLSIAQKYTSEESLMDAFSSFPSLRPTDLLSAALTLMNFDDWVVTPLLTVDKGKGYARLMEMQSWVRLLTEGQRCCLFWLCCFLEKRKNDWGAYEMVSSRLGSLQTKSILRTVLPSLVSHLDFVFCSPVQGKQAAGDGTIDHHLSMDQSFEEIQAAAKREEKVTSYRELLLKQLDVKPLLFQPEYIFNEGVKWDVSWKEFQLCSKSNV